MSRTIALLIAVLAAGCNSPEVPTAPASVNPPVPLTLTISHVGPKEGWPCYYTQVFGTGFHLGVRVTFGGVDAIVSSFGNESVATSPPWREPGTTVDVVATNPDGSSVTLAAGFTYRTATLALSKADVRAGESVVVTWSGPPDPSDFAPPDVIGCTRSTIHPTQRSGPRPRASATDSQRNSRRPSAQASMKFDITCSASTCWPT